MKVSPVEIRLWLDPGPDPLTGAIGGVDGAPKPFQGWIELATAIERLRSATIADEARYGRVHGDPADGPCGGSR